MNKRIKTHIKGQFFIEAEEIRRNWNGVELRISFGIRYPKTGDILTRSEHSFVLYEGQRIDVGGIEARMPAELSVSGDLTVDGIKMLWAEELDWLEADNG